MRPRAAGPGKSGQAPSPSRNGKHMGLQGQAQACELLITIFLS